MENQKYIVIGLCEVDKNGKIVKLDRQWFRQGYIYKNPNAYENDKSAVCYVPELSDSTYTGQDFLDICNGQQDFADELFGGVDWQHPETLMEDWFVNNEWKICEGCGKLVDYGEGCNDKKCPFCGKDMEVE